MIYGLIGEKLSHSYSPGIHKIFFDITGKKGDYRLIELPKDELRAFLLNAHKQGFIGLNVTIPYKTEVIPFIDELSDEAVKIGAINTIELKNGLKGYNTDYFGIDFTMKKCYITLSRKKALVTGSGGAAKSVIAYLEDNGISEIYMASRDPDDLKYKFPSIIAVSYDEIINFAPFNIIVNTTPVGMYPNAGASPLTKEQLKGADFIFDLIYNPAKTKLMELADDLNIPNINGLTMLIAQAVRAQEIWNNEIYGSDLIDTIMRSLNIQ